MPIMLSHLPLCLGCYLCVPTGASSTDNNEEGGGEDKPLLLAGRNERNASSAQSTSVPAPEGWVA